MTTDKANLFEFIYSVKKEGSMFMYAKHTIACTHNVKNTKTNAEYLLADVFLMNAHRRIVTITSVAGRIQNGFHFVAKVTRLIIM